MDRHLDMADLSQLLDANDMIESTEAWREMGMPANLVAFGTDCSGNLFCFKSEEPGPVLFFDHDFGTTREVAPSFTIWIEAFCRLATH